MAPRHEMTPTLPTAPTKPEPDSGWLVVLPNEDGRPCLWAHAPTREDIPAAMKWCKDHWPTHGGSGCGCYPGERSGAIEVTKLGAP